MMSSANVLFLPLLLLAIIPVYSLAFDHLRTPRLSITGDSDLLAQNAESEVIKSILNESQTFFYEQTLDHFNYKPESYANFKQKYVIYSKYWEGENSSGPIFAYLGAEDPLVQEIRAAGFPADNALRFKALILYIEHRFYGDSIPFGLSLEEALNNSDTRGYFNTAQALADYAEVIIHVKRTLNAKKSPVIVMGGSYGGMLASWFRLKYPHVAMGAFASSAPILLPANFTLHHGYYTLVTKSFRKTSETCYETIKRSWTEIDRAASETGGLQYLSTTFKTCKPLRDADELKDHLASEYASAAQYNNPFSTPVANFCNAVDLNQSSRILEKIFAGMVAITRNSTNSSCYVNPPQNASQTSIGWRWQTCSDIVIPLAYGNMSMFPNDDNYTPRDYIEGCKSLYGVAPRPHWVSTYFGGQGMKLILQSFGSNIIFSNGLKDPYSNGGVLADISDTILAVYTTKGSHCLDLAAATAKDPEWLVKQRETEVEILKKWLDKYYNDLKRRMIST